ncbi:MAG: PQQ-dependent sugar dehydrogenase [Sphingomonas sp.]
MRTGTALGVLMLLAACSSGGDGGGSGGGAAPSPTPTPANTAPTFTSAASATVAENTTGVVYQATATDAQANPITFSIAGGADAALFAITAAGALTFIHAPDFEAPADAGANNVYNVQLRASDGTVSSTLDLVVTVTDAGETVRVRRIATRLSQPLFVAPVPGNNDRVFVVGKTGTVYYLTPSTGAVTTAFTVGNLSTDGERGLLGLAARPDFATSNVVFVHATAPDGTIEIREYTIGSAGYRTVLTVPHPGANNHNGGWIAFGPDGYLYDTTGDGGTGGNNAQDASSRLGKILRIKIDTTPGSTTPFGPAPGNPFLAGGGDPYVFALGLRNPFRNSFDGNRLIIGDVGEGSIEEIDIVGIDQPGLNFGWPFMEGTRVNRSGAPAGLTGPVSEYPHGNGAQQGSTVIGGYVYRGGIAALQGSYVFGDYISKNIWTIPATSLVPGAVLPASSYVRRNPDFVPDTGTIDQLVSFGTDGANNLYLVDIDGDVFFVDPDPRFPL